LKNLVTGVDGFTGVHFVRLARKCGRQLVALKSRLEDREGLCREMAECAPEAVVHLAAISSRGRRGSIPSSKLRDTPEWMLECAERGAN
jgi:nucleoside-diphosphate-sugar epimerase